MLTYVLRYNLYGLALFVDMMVLIGILLFSGIGLVVFAVLLLEMVVILLSL